MILPYFLRLFCLSFASFFLLNASLSLLVLAVSNRALRFSESTAASAAARMLFALRLLPFALAAFFVIALCVPSYLWLEPAGKTEEVGVFCAACGATGALLWCLSLGRALRAIVKSVLHNRSCLTNGCEVTLPGDASRLVVVENNSPLLATSGLLRPRIFISRGVLEQLLPEELEAALSHEQAHRASRDNLKRLLLLFAPDAFPFVQALRRLEPHWARLTEWAADDEAANGDPLRAITLAAALVRVARLGTTARLPYLATSLVASDRDLTARVSRLVHAAPAPARVMRRDARTRRIVSWCAAGVGLLLLSPLLLSSVHELLERLMH